MKHIHIYETPGGGYIVKRQSRLQAFIYEWRQYGLGVAVHNAIWQRVHRNDRMVKTEQW